MKKWLKENSGILIASIIIAAAVLISSEIISQNLLLAINSLSGSLHSMPRQLFVYYNTLSKRTKRSPLSAIPKRFKGDLLEVCIPVIPHQGIVEKAVPSFYLTACCPTNSFPYHSTIHMIKRYSHQASCWEFGCLFFIWMAQAAQDMTEDRSASLKQVSFDSPNRIQASQSQMSSLSVPGHRGSITLSSH